MLDFGLLGDFEGVIDFDAEISHRAFQLGMSKQELDRSQVLSPAVDQRRFGSAHGVRAIGLWVKADGIDPGFDEPRILPGRQVLAGAHSARKQKSTFPMTHHFQPCFDGIAGWLRDFELDGPAGLFLDNDGSGGNTFAVPDVGDFDRDQVAATQLAVDCQIEQCQVAFLSSKLELDPDGPDVLPFQGRFLANEPPAVPRPFRTIESC